MIKLCFLTSIFVVFSLSSQAQENCVVKLKDIEGTYTGGCLNGKANGTGKSTGVDQYEGEFKDGYPEGKGKYLWKDGHYFVGGYKKGSKEGKGGMYYKRADGTDSIISGYWKKDKYIGEYEKQYEVISNTSNVQRVDCRLIDARGENISITLHQSTNTSTATTPSIIPSISSVSPVQGSFNSKNVQVLTNSSVTTIRGVSFPFKAIFYTSHGESSEILFNAKGDYDVYIDTR